MSYEPLAAFIIEHVGGADNIKGVSHCLTRLRFDLVDDSKIDEDALNAETDILATQFSGGLFQVVIGTHVSDVEDEVEKQLGTAGASAETEAVVTETVEDETGERPIDRLAAVITKIMTPMMSVLCGCGIIVGLMAVLVALGVISSSSGTYQVLSAMGYACITFSPVILGYTSAKAFGLDPIIGMVLGAALMYPDLAESMTADDVLGTVFDGTPMVMSVCQSFLGIPVLLPSNGYSSTVVPIILSTFFASKVEKWCKKILPQAVQQFMVPAIVVLVAGLVTFLIIGPAAVMLTNLIVWGINALPEIVQLIACMAISLIYQPLVVFGQHWFLSMISLVEFAMNGSTLVFALNFPASWAHMAVCAAIMLRTKDEKLRRTARDACISACFCIIEPSFYGVTLTVKKRFGICMLSSAAGALILELTDSRMYGIVSGVIGLVGFIDPATGSISGLLNGILAVMVTMVLGFALTWITYTPSDDQLSASAADA